MKLVHFILLTLIVILSVHIVACKKEDSDSKPINPAVEKYIDEIIQIMKVNSINRKNIDWEVFKSDFLLKASGAQTIPDAFDAIRYGISKLQDQHSFYVTAGGTALANSSNLHCVDENPSTPIVPLNIGYLRINGTSTQGIDARILAESIQRSIRLSDRDSLKGWIIDLRANGGGNMWPMLAGVGPILGDGIAGYFVNPDHEAIPWSYKDGEVFFGAGSILKISTVPYILKKNNPRVAILHNKGTASSGEAMIISFKNRNNTRSYGLPSCGVSTGNTNFRLSDGATLILTTSTMADRTKTLYGKSVAPDIADSNSSIYLQQAISWLQE